VYLFDDSFSALDYATDAALRLALAPRTREATVLLVAQRVATIRHAEQIIVLDHGRIVGSGTHDELLDTCETYQEIVYSQLSAQEAA
jgi:ATP-binding cassette, subfamily B, multidrug efflux pump